MHKPSANVKVKDGALIVHLQKKEKFKEWKRLGVSVLNHCLPVIVSDGGMF